MAKTIKLKDNNILRLEIEDYDGNKTGEYLEFDIEDISLPLKYQEALEKHKKNEMYLKQQMIIIGKREDIKGKKLLSKNQEDKINTMIEYCKREMDAMDLFLGKDGCKKLLNGREPYYTMFEDINDVLQPILPELELNAKNIEDKIKEKYSTRKEDGVLE